MEWLNYHHLLYFWTVVREGTVARAGERLSLAQPTISGQLRTLENVLGEKLFTRSGRHLVPTDTGRLVYRYADEIFSIGHSSGQAAEPTAPYGAGPIPGPTVSPRCVRRGTRAVRGGVAGERG